MNENESRQVNMGAITTDVLQLPELTHKRLQAAVLRLDKMHPVVSGNKWFKLHYHLEHARKNASFTIITFGGAYSNHIVAAAYACMQQGFKSIGIIRGEKPAALSHTLRAAKDYGMELQFVTREAYAQKPESERIQQILSRYGKFYVIPEGGSGEEGIRGCRDILQLADSSTYTHIMCSIGTGTMFYGLAQSLNQGQQLIGIPVLKIGSDSALLKSINTSLRELKLSDSCNILLKYDFGGYAKKTPQLLDFMNNFFLRTGIPTDFVYTGKLLFAFSHLVESNYFPPESNVLIVHSGGLQGNASLPAQTLVF